jgi:anti-sigma factor RsiW
MNCEQAKPLIPLYVDGELDTTQSLEMERHLQQCPACAKEWRALLALQKFVRQEELFFAAPAALRRNLLAELRGAAGRTAEPSFWSWKWLAAAMSGAATVCLAFLLVLTLRQPSAGDALARELVSSHIRSLMASHALDVVSTDQHTVKPWFDGKLDFAPPVKDLATQGFPLIGGRLDYINNRAVAALVFQRHKHVINLFIWPGVEKDSTPSVTKPRQGYNVIHWSQAGMSCWAVSDLNQQELLEFADDFSS